MKTLITKCVLFVFLLTDYSCKKTSEVIVKIKDIDGNIYNTISIGSQDWMSENLKTTRYQNGDSIGTTYPANLDISNESTPIYQWIYTIYYGPNNEYSTAKSYLSIYGRLYTWFAVTDSRNICPEGWHVPSRSEWEVLFYYLTENGYGYGGLKNNVGKSLASIKGWTYSTYPGSVGNDQKSNNSSGFNALPGGIKLLNGSFEGVNDNGNWWCSTEISNETASSQNLTYVLENLIKTGTSKQNALSVRCIKDR